VFLYFRLLIVRTSPGPMRTSPWSCTQNHFWIVRPSYGLVRVHLPLLVLVLLELFGPLGGLVQATGLVQVSRWTSACRLFGPYLRGSHLFVLTLEHLATLAPIAKVTQWWFHDDSLHSRCFLGCPSPKTGLDMLTQIFTSQGILLGFLDSFYLMFSFVKSLWSSCP
jgi:hypothetical protein